MTHSFDLRSKACTLERSVPCSSHAAAIYWMKEMSSWTMEAEKRRSSSTGVFVRASISRKDMKSVSIY